MDEGNSVLIIGLFNCSRDKSKLNAIYQTYDGMNIPVYIMT